MRTMLGDRPVFPILLSKDLAASRAFYHDLLGLEVLREDEERIIFRCGGGTQLAVTLSTIGTADEDEIADMGFAWSAWISDPGGNALAIIQPKARAPRS